jgi:hypothetical protein
MMPNRTPRIAFRKEQIAEYQRRGGAVQEEVVPLERGPDTGRQNHAQARTPGAVIVSSALAFWHGFYLPLAVTPIRRLRPRVARARSREFTPRG